MTQHKNKPLIADDRLFAALLVVAFELVTQMEHLGIQILHIHKVHHLSTVPEFAPSASHKKEISLSLVSPFVKTNKQTNRQTNKQTESSEIQYQQPPGKMTETSMLERFSTYLLLF